jgi:GAF domain-containing protein
MGYQMRRASASWVLPLVHRDEAMGVLTLGKKVLPTRFHSEDRQLLETLGLQSASFVGAAERQAQIGAQFDLRRKLANFTMVFGTALRDKVLEEASPQGKNSRSLATTTFESTTITPGPRAWPR